MLTVIVLCAASAFVCSILALMGKCPPAVGTLLICVAFLLTQIPK